MKHRIARRLCVNLFVLIALIAVLAAAPRVEAGQPVEESWQVIYLDDQRIGYSRSASQTTTDQGRTIIRTTTDVHMKLKRFGQPMEMRISRETDATPAGDLLAFQFEMQEVKSPAAAPTRSVGRVEGEKLLIQTTIGGQTTDKAVPLEGELKSPDYQDRLIREPLIKPGETRSFETFDPMLGRTTTVKLTADEHRLVKLLDEKPRKLLKVRIEQSILPGMTSRSFFDEKGTALRTEEDMGGSLMVTYAVPKEEALQEIAGGELDIAVNTLVKVAPIPNAHRTERIVYRLTVAGDDPSKYLVADSMQRVEPVSPETVELTVTPARLPGDARQEPAAPKYLAATQFLQADDARVVEHARKATAGQSDPRKIAVGMERYVHQQLSKKNFSTALASAAEVAKNLEGDCTEHAVLLAAMLRAAKIPSRIAVGLVYVESRESFGGHMWTEAWLGDRWYPLDATLGQGRIGAAHIKLAESSFADDAPAPVTTFLPLLKVLGKLKIEVVESR